MFHQILEAAMADKKSVNLYVNGQVLGGAVTKLDTEAVELRNREYSRIVVRLASIHAVAMI